MVMDLIVKILIQILIIVISAIPLWLAVKMLGGKATILKVIIVNLLVALAAFVIGLIIKVGWVGSVLTAVALLFIYSFMFRIGWVRSALAWLLQVIIAVILIAIFALFGIPLVIF
ncbi:hypothetical protein GF351_01615 [Candidatus Woesearchaeota archaeon]|nr:hypothetical protein [Candidatus Woesearchaeota archaeon]